jgi:chemotaxis signal transduction protein
VIIETEAGARAALLVDAIQGQRQVVIKSLETNYQQVEGVAAATILGDGRVALILDVDAIVAAWRKNAPSPSRPTVLTQTRELIMTEPQRRRPRELIAFRIGEQEFCVDIMSVREIRGWTPATPLPRAPGFMKGVINLRGAVLPIIDLGARFGLRTSEPTARHVIMVAHVGGRMVGLLVDAVSDIIQLTTRRSSRRPTSPATGPKTFVKGLFAIDGRMISLIELDRSSPTQRSRSRMTHSAGRESLVEGEFVFTAEDFRHIAQILHSHAGIA